MVSPACTHYSHSQLSRPVNDRPSDGCRPYTPVATMSQMQSVQTVLSAGLVHKACLYEAWRWPLVTSRFLPRQLVLQSGFYQVPCPYLMISQLNRHVVAVEVSWCPYLVCCVSVAGMTNEATICVHRLPNTQPRYHIIIRRRRRVLISISYLVLTFAFRRRFFLSACLPGHYPG